MMPGVLSPSNVALVVEGRQPTRAYQPLGSCAQTAGHRKAAHCPHHCRYLSASKACIVMLHLQSKDRTTYVRNLLTSAWKAASGSIAKVSVILASCGVASDSTGKQWTHVAPWNQHKYSRYVASSNGSQSKILHNLSKLKS